MPISNILLLASLPLEGFIFFGTILGWPSFVEVLKELKVYESSCDVLLNSTTTSNEIVNCAKRDSFFSAAGTIGSFSMNVSVLLMGEIIKKFGIFRARAALTLVVTAGLICFLFTPQVNWLMFPAVFLYSCGNYSFVLTNSMMSILFPTIGALVLTVGQGFFQAGSSYFRILALAFDNGISYNWIIGFNILLTLPVWCRSIFLFPEINFKDDISTFSQSFFGNRRKKAASKVSAKLQADEEIKKGEISESYKPYFDASYVLMVVWIVFMNLNCLFAIFTWNSYTRLVAGENYKTHVDDFGAYAWTAAPFAMICGIVSDTFGKNIKSRPVRFGKLLGVWLFVILNLIVGVIFGFLQLSFDEKQLLAIIFIYNIYRAWGYTLTPVFCKFMFPEKFYGKLIGIQRFLLGITSLLVLGLQEIPNSFGRDGFTAVFYFFISVQGIMILFPFVFGKKLFSIRE